jgi:serine/threonine-protein kinase
MAVVYLAHHGEDRRKVAVKIIQRELSSVETIVLRFQNEANVVARLSHPNTIRVLDSGQTETGDLYIVTEFLSGRSVASELEAGPMPFERLIRIAEQVCLSLSEAHAAGIIHRDIKPHNIFVDDSSGDAAVKLIDFGLAKWQDSLSVTAPNVLVGSILYVSPEQAGQAEIDHRTDIYSLGVTMYQMATGRCPFNSEKIFEVLREHLFAPPPDMRLLRPDVPQELEQLILRMLEKDPARRPETVDAVRAELARIQIAQPIGGAVPRFDSKEEGPTNVEPRTKIISVDPPARGAARSIAFYAAVAVGLGCVALLASALMETPAETARIPLAGEVAPPVETAPAEQPTQKPIEESIETPPIEAEAPEPKQDLEAVVKRSKPERSVPEERRPEPVRKAQRRERKQARFAKKAERAPEAPPTATDDPPPEKPLPEKPRPLPVTF